MCAGSHLWGSVALTRLVFRGRGRLEDDAPWIRKLGPSQVCKGLCASRSFFLDPACSGASVRLATVGGAGLGCEAVQRAGEW